VSRRGSYGLIRIASGDTRDCCARARSRAARFDARATFLPGLDATSSRPNALALGSFARRTLALRIAFGALLFLRLAGGLAFGFAFAPLASPLFFALALFCSRLLRALFLGRRRLPLLFWRAFFSGTLLCQASGFRSFPSFRALFLALKGELSRSSFRALGFCSRPPRAPFALCCSFSFERPSGRLFSFERLWAASFSF
jgi:hypothetical protein